jgi:hypothetical protein
MRGPLALSAFVLEAKVAESTATTVTGSIAGDPPRGGVAG